MSNEAITWAYRQPISTGAKFVLVALADLADEGHSCYPGQAKLATMTGQGDRTVRRQLLELEVAGYITRQRRFDKMGHRTSDRYVLPVGQEIPTGQSDHRSERPPVNSATGHIGLRSITTSLPATDDSPTGQNGRVSLSEPTKEPSEAARDDVERLCNHLADAIGNNDEDRKRPEITQAWRDAARLLLDRDKRSEEKIHRAIDWCQADEFWRGNVLSMSKLRKQYPALQAQARRKPNKPRQIDEDDPMGWAR